MSTKSYLMIRFREELKVAFLFIYLFNEIRKWLNLIQ